MQQEQMAAQEQQQEMALASQAGQILKSPLMDPTKNADLQPPLEEARKKNPNLKLNRKLKRRPPVYHQC